MSKDAKTAQRVLAAWSALRSGKMKVAPKFDAMATELIAAPLTITGLVDTSKLSEEVIAFARTAGMGVCFMSTSEHAEPADTMPMPDIQLELFQLFERLFFGLTGISFEKVDSLYAIKQIMLDRLKHSADQMARSANDAMDDLNHFYSVHALEIFKHAESFGGIRLVTGGQRAFGPSALNAVRITGLYADTQLIPDPIFPFLAAHLKLNAKHLQLAIALFTILQIKPLVSAKLPVPPVFVFPSFEQGLEEQDAYTKIGIENLLLQVVGPHCKSTIASIEELFEYSKKYEDDFIHSVLSNRLFVPPGVNPSQVLSRDAAVQTYFAEIRGIRDAKIIAQMECLPPGVLILNGIMERLSPQYHLLENANELGAQPLLSQAVHWHYFETCAKATAQELNRKSVLSDQAFQTLKAVQDDSLSWLANIPIQQLAELIANNEHRSFREELNSYTSLLSSANIDPNQMVQEVSHGLASLVQRQQKAMKDIEAKYAPKKATALVTGTAGLVVAGTAWLLPSLSSLLGAAVPAVAALAALGAGSVTYSREKAGEIVEKRQAKRSLLGVLATIRPR